MARILKLEDSEKGRERFGIYWQALLLGAHADRPRPIDVLRSEARLYEALRSASKPVTLPDGQSTRLRELSGTASLRLEQPEHSLLEQYIPTAPWRPDSVCQVVDAVDWLAAAPIADAETKA